MIDGHPIGRTRLAVLLFLLIALKGNSNLNCAALQYQPLEIYAKGEECALILDGHARTSVFDYTYNLLRGTFPTSSGSQTCITYDAVNRAYVEARKRINVVRPNSDALKPEELASVGELLLDISVNLAHTYGLTREEIEKSLPLIDTSKTLIHEVCPAYLSNVECRPGKYRRYDGLCTNLENPSWGATLTPFTRLIEPNFADGITAPRISVTGNELPLSRIVSRTMHPDEGYHDHAGTVMVIAWGQFMDHDYTLTGTPLDPLNRNDPEECCSLPPHLKNPYCNEILIPEDDYFYRLFNVRCMDFVRAFPAVRPGCRLGSRVPFNLLTGVLDGNTVYGITETFARKLRTGYGGLLRMNPIFSEYGLKDLLPLKLDIPDEGCTRPNRSMYCFEAGEIRVNEQLVLTCMHTLLAREHNRAAKELAHVNPHWDDETIFQEARRIVIAQIQHVTYNEFLPILLGKDVMEKFGLLLEKNEYWDGYDSSVNPGVIDAFASAAFRFGHSLLPTAVERWSKAHKFIASKRLSDLIRRPYDLYRAGVLDEYFMGLMNQVAQAMDDSITQEVTNHLFKKVGAKFGMDLVSFNMQRGREFGIPSYMEFRKFCGLPGADTFDELFGSMPNETIARYSSIFEHPSDVDLWSGGVSERPLPGSMLGPTFACVIATQFSYSRRGDRFWYELPNQPSSFTLDQLNEIRKTGLAKLICDNTDLIDTIQLYPMVLPDHEINPRVPCRSGILPSIDFSKWAEFPTTSHATQYNIIVEESVLQAKHVQAPPTLAYARMLQRGWISTINDEISSASHIRKRIPEVYWHQRNKSLMKYRQKLKQNRFGSMSIVDFLRSPRNKIRSEFNQKLNRQVPLRDRLQRFAVNNSSNRVAARKMSYPVHLFPNDIVQITTIIETIRRRSKRNADLANTSVTKGSKRASANTNAKEKKLEFLKMFSNGNSRVKRDTNRIYNRKTRSLLKKLYRHPRLSAEDQRERNRTNNQIRESETTTRNITNRDLNTVAGTRKLQTITEVQRRPSPKSSYTPIFKECNETAASEIADLNIPPPSLKYVKSKKPIIIPDIDFPHTDANEREPVNHSPSTNKENEDSKESRKSTSKPMSTPLSRDKSASTVPIQSTSEVKNKTYINLQDHQKTVQNPDVPKDPNGYPADIPPYNPDVIPYVDVPDYSDQREESLDKDDRHVAKEKLKDYDNEDVVNPDAPSNNDERSETAVQQSRDDEDEDDKEEVSSLDKEDIIAPRDRDTNESRREEEEDSEDEERPREKLQNVEEKSEEKERKGKEEEEGEEEEEVDEKLQEQSQEVKQPDTTFNFEPIHFDINDYIKPFDLEELFKDDPTSETEKSKREKTENINGNDDGSKVDDDDDYFKKYRFDASNHQDQVDKDHPKTSVPDHFNTEFEDIFGNVSFIDPTFEHDTSEGPKKLKIVNEDEFRYGDKDFFRPIYESRDKLFRYKNDDDYYSRYFSDDVARKLKGQDKDEVDDERTSESRIDKLLNDEEVHKTLSTILSKKDDISRINEDLNKKVKEDGTTPQQYKNYWTLEYSTPVKNKTTGSNKTDS